MNRFLIGWVCALLLATVWPNLLPASLLLLSIPAAILLRRYPILLGFILGLSLWHGQAYRQVHPLHPLLAEHSERVELIATVVALPNGGQIYQRTLWQVEAINSQKIAIFWCDLVRLGWAQPDKLKQGQRFRLQVTLKPPSGVLNQGGSNARKSLLSKGIVATGYIRSAQLLEANIHWRQQLADTLEIMTEPLARGPLIRALALGDRRGLSEQHWQGLKASGLVHLVAISGLHLTIVALWCAVIGQRLLPALWPSQRGAGAPILWLSCAVIVIGYAAVAGHSLPTQRAMIMVLLGLVLCWRRRESQIWEITLRAAALVLLVNPLAALGIGFWLSFGAIGTLLLLNWWRPLGHEHQPQKAKSHWRVKVRHFIYLQCGLAIIMPLIQGLTLDLYTLQAVWANLLVLPLFSLLILPVCLLSALLALTLDWHWPLVLTDQILWLITLCNDLALTMQQYWPWLGGHLSMRHIVIFLLLLGASGLLWLKPWRGWHWQALLLLSPLLLRALHKPNDWQLHLVDVGQGLAAVIQQNDRFLLYDTGAAFTRYSYARSAVLPMLQERGATELDYLVLSHGDNDHAGGAKIIRQHLPILHNRGWQASCTGTEQWGKLTLTWWRQHGSGKGNNHSCTLRIADGEHSVLLSGDIERAAERRMLKAKQVSPVTVLVAPHHGSGSSSSPAWLAALQPQWVLIPAGWQNRWGFPHDHVLARYQALGSQIKTVGEVGQISMRFASNEPPQLLTQRQHRAPWWYNQQ